MPLDKGAVRAVVGMVLKADGAIGEEALLDHVPQGKGSIFVRGWEHHLPGAQLHQGSWGAASVSGRTGAAASAAHGVYLPRTLIDQLVSTHELTLKPRLKKWLSAAPLLGSLRVAIGVSKTNPK